MKLKFIALFLVILFAYSNAISLQQIENDIKQAGEINPTIVGPLITAYLQTALQESSLKFVSSPKFTLTTNELDISGVLTIWDVPVTTSLAFTNASGTLELDLSFAVNSTVIGGLKGIFEKIAPTQYKPELSQLVISGGTIKASLSTTGKESGLTLSASIDLSSTGLYGKLLVQLVKAYVNPLALHFYFPITTEGTKLGAMITKLPQNGFGSVHFTINVPGTYRLASGIYATDVALTIFLGSVDSVTANANVLVHAGPRNVTFASTGTLALGEPITLTGNLIGTWSDPFGINWITLDTATYSVTLDLNPTVSVTGSGPLSFDNNEPVDITVAISLQGFVISMTGVPVADLPGFFEAVSGHTPTVASQLKVQGTAGITVASFSYGQFQEGLTLQGTTTITSTSSDLYKAVKALNPSVTGSEEFKFRLFVPIFTPTAPVTFSLTYDNNYPYQTGLQVTMLQLMVTVGADNMLDIDLSADFAAKPANNPTPVTFSLSGDWVAGQDITLSGQLTSTWNDAFGAKWLSITQASATLTLGKPSDALNIDATAVFTFNNQKDTVSMQLNSGDNFAQYCFTANLDKLWNVSVVVDTVTGQNVPIAQDFKGQDNVDYVFSMCNYDGGSSPDGVTLQVSGQILGALEKRIHYISPGQIPTLIFDSSLYLPILSTNPTNFRFYLNVKDPIQVNPHLIFHQVIINLDGGISGLASLETKFECLMNKNPAPIYFDLKGEITAEGAMTLTGLETGQWNDIFGIKGFDLANVDAELAINPASCVTGCVSDVGLGFTTVIGTKTVKYAGNLASPDFFDCFLQGNVTGNNGSLILSMRDLALHWNKNVPNHPIDVNIIPADMGLNSAFFGIAGQSGQFGSYTYKEGFEIQAIMEVLEIFSTVTVGCSVSGLSPDCDFDVNVNIDYQKFLAELKKYVHIFAPEGHEVNSFGVWELKKVGLSDFSTSLLSQKIYPLWDIEIEVFGHTYNLNFRTELAELEGTFKAFYDKYIKHIFG